MFRPMVQKLLNIEYNKYCRCEFMKIKKMILCFLFFWLLKVRHILGFCWKALKELGLRRGI
jgi:hypothetical protein